MINTSGTTFRRLLSTHPLSLSLFKTLENLVIIICSFIIEVVIRNFHIHIIMVHCYLTVNSCCLKSKLIIVPCPCSCCLRHVKFDVFVIIIRDRKIEILDDLMGGGATGGGQLSPN